MIAAIMLTTYLATAAPAPAPERSLTDRRLDALAQVESGNRDEVRGPDGERSRYQIAPATWKEYGRSVPFARATNPAIARHVARQILTARIIRFMRSHHRAPSEIEVYVLWHKPSSINQPSERTREMAARFANLLETP